MHRPRRLGVNEEDKRIRSKNKRANRKTRVSQCAVRVAVAAAECEMAVAVRLQITLAKYGNSMFFEILVAASSLFVVVSLSTRQRLLKIRTKG